MTRAPAQPSKPKKRFDPYDESVTARQLINFIKLRAAPGELTGTYDKNTPKEVLQRVAQGYNDAR
jgi:hypothetical protein